ncbi:MAG: chemotaxis protein methyltransferase CheR [Thermoleophilales bacterium]|jgi:chemotaxis protein methyltransferase CheR|nr:chemotaxis protein methyltransferase CheR [Thermoleophilales bacterium]
MESATATRRAWARAQQADDDLERVEMQLLLEGIYQHYGYDFRGYAVASLKRRLWKRVHAEGLTTLSGLQDRVLHDAACMDRLLHDLSINVTSMFRDPSFYVAFREQVVPLLRTYPFVRIWNAGCSTGEETYSLAILLHEAGLHEKTRLYATDINDTVLERAQRGRFPLERMRDYTANYLRAGGKEEFSRYYSVEGDEASFSDELRGRVVFANHNLVSDGPFNEFNVIVCRNVMIYFGKGLQDRVHDLFYNSLETFGVLALGHKESIKFTRHEAGFELLNSKERLYRKIR